MPLKYLFMTNENIGDYVTFPEFIFSKWKQGIITHTHMTDLLRLELLILEAENEMLDRYLEIIK